MSLFETKRLFVSEAGQQPLVDITMLIADAGLAITLLVLAHSDGLAADRSLQDAAVGPKRLAEAKLEATE